MPLISSTMPLIKLLLLLFLFIQASRLTTARINSTTALIAQFTSSDEESETYIFDLTVGTNASQTVQVTFDISSPTTSLGCGPPPAFDPTQSSTFRKFHCTRGSSKSKTNKYAVNCTGEDTVALKRHVIGFPDPADTVSIPGVDFKCTEPSGKSSVVGFAPGSKLSLLSQIGKNSGKLIAPGQFAYCMPRFVVIGKPESYGYFINSGQLGSFSTSGWPQVKLLKLKGEGYAVAVKSISVSGIPAELPAGGIILKLSTSGYYTKLESSVYKAVRAAFRKSIGYGERVNAVAPVEPFDTCFDARPLVTTGGRYGMDLSRLPGIGLGFSGGGSSWGFSARNMVVLVQGMYDVSVVCMGILDAGNGKPSILGTYQQRDQILHYDVDHSLLGIGYLSFDIFSSAPPGCSGIWMR